MKLTDIIEEDKAVPKKDENFTVDDLTSLELIPDLEKLKVAAFKLISNKHGRNTMKPQKVEWFRRALEQKNSKMKVIKLMWDLLLSGEDLAVKGTSQGTDPSNYRQAFGEEEVDEAGKGRARDVKITPSLSKGENKRNKKAASSKERQQGQKAARTVNTDMPSAWPGLMGEEEIGMDTDQWLAHHDALAHGPDDEGFDDEGPTDQDDAFVSGHFIELDPSDIGAVVDMSPPIEPDDNNFDSQPNRNFRKNRNDYETGRMARRESVNESADPEVVKALKALFE